MIVIINSDNVFGGYKKQPVAWNGLVRYQLAHNCGTK